MADLNLALLIFVVCLLNQIVSWVGKSVLQELAFNLYASIFLNSSAKQQKILRKQILEDKSELSKTSPQDEFAKWAKLKRKIDKGLADLEKINGNLGSAKSSFGVKFSSTIWILTTGSSFVLVWWFRKQPVFWLPQGWVPGPVKWILSFSSAPSGSVSSGAWAAVCKQVLSTGEEIVKNLLTPLPAAMPPNPFQPQQTAPTQSAKIQELEHEKVD